MQFLLLSVRLSAERFDRVEKFICSPTRQGELLPFFIPAKDSARADTFISSVTTVPSQRVYHGRNVGCRDRTVDEIIDNENDLVVGVALLYRITDLHALLKLPRCVIRHFHNEGLRQSIVIHLQGFFGLSLHHTLKSELNFFRAVDMVSANRVFCISTTTLCMKSPPKSEYVRKNYLCRPLVTACRVFLGVPPCYEEKVLLHSSTKPTLVLFFIKAGSAPGFSCPVDIAFLYHGGHDDKIEFGKHSAKHGNDVNFGIGVIGTDVH